LDPRIWLAGIIWTLLVAIAGYMTGHETASDQAERVQRENTVNANRTIAAMNDWRIEQSAALRLANNARFDSHRQQEAKAHEQTDRLIADLRSDNRRLRIPVRACGNTETAASGTLASGHQPQGYAELDGATSAALVAITRDGDDAIRKHALVVDAYEDLRKACTAPLPAPDQP
jgi:hypothetical protein